MTTDTLPFLADWEEEPLFPIASNDSFSPQRNPEAGNDDTSPR